MTQLAVSVSMSPSGKIHKQREQRTSALNYFCSCSSKASLY